MVFFCVKGIYRQQDYYKRGFIESKGIHFHPYFVTELLPAVIFVFFSDFPILQEP
jgi:hypothetical protein